jgi:hypothetical protein
VSIQSQDVESLVSGSQRQLRLGLLELAARVGVLGVEAERVLLGHVEATLAQAPQPLDERLLLGRAPVQLSLPRGNYRPFRAPLSRPGSAADGCHFRSRPFVV